MGVSPLFRLPFPEGGEDADGPGAFTAFANRVNDAQATAAGRSGDAPDLDITVAAGATAIVASYSIQHSQAGWQQVTFNYHVRSNVPGQASAGMFDVWANGQRLRRSRWHTAFGGGSQTRALWGMQGGGSACWAVTGRNQTTNLRFEVVVDGGLSSSVRVFLAAMSLQALGSPIWP